MFGSTLICWRYMVGGMMPLGIEKRVAPHARGERAAFERQRTRLSKVGSKAFWFAPKRSTSDPAKAR